MAQAPLTAEIERLRVQLQTFAAIGAALRLRQDGVAGDPAIASLVREVVEAHQPGLLDGIGPTEAAAALAMIRHVAIDALDIIERPGRAPGWSVDDPANLQATGEMSASVVRRIIGLAADRPHLAAALAGAGRFLDVGTGVAGIALAAARAWPAMRVVGLDIWPASLALARANVAASDVAARIEIRTQNVLDLPERDAFNVIWMPTQFMPKSVTAAALAKVHGALVPGGSLVLGIFTQQTTPLVAAISRLRTVRGGGYPWTAEELAGELRALGYVDVDVPPPSGPSHNILARRAG